MNYTDWKPISWITPFSKVKWLFFDSLTDTGDILSISLYDQGGNTYTVSFINYPAYRNIPEEYRLNLWGIRDQSWGNLGNSWVVENSDWLETLTTSEPLIIAQEDELFHFIICTESAVIEILSSDLNPKIQTTKK